MPADVDDKFEAPKAGDSAVLHDIRGDAFAKPTEPASFSAISADRRIDELNEFNATFDPKNHNFSQEELNAMFDKSVTDIAQVQQFIATRLKDLNLTVDQDLATPYLVGRRGEDLQITDTQQK